MARFDEGPQLLANIVGPGAVESAAIGAKVKVVFETRAEGFRVPQLELMS